MAKDMSTPHLTNTLRYIENYGYREHPFGQAARRELNRRDALARKKGKAMAAKKLTKQELIDKVIRSPFTIWFRRVFDMKNTITGAVVLRASTSQHGRVYLKVPPEWTNGVYLTVETARILAAHLEQAITQRRAIDVAPERAQVIRVQTLQGDVVEVPVPSGIIASRVTLA